VAALNPANPCLLTINGGSSSIRFALYEAGEALERRLHGKIDRIGLSGTNLTVGDSAGKPEVPRRLAAADHRTAVEVLLDRLDAQPVFASRRSPTASRPSSKRPGANGTPRRCPTTSGSRPPGG
jgi:hypothetical protein